jgi:transposase-like protein
MYGVDQNRTAIHNWVQEADLQPAGDGTPNRIAVEETVIRINDERHWLYATVEPKTSEFLRVRGFQTGTRQLTCFCMNSARNSRSNTRRVSPMVNTISPLTYNDSASDFGGVQIRLKSEAVAVFTDP